VIDGNALSEAEDSGVLLIARGKYVLSVGGIKRAERRWHHF
jgi:hypothetical protein